MAVTVVSSTFNQGTSAEASIAVPGGLAAGDMLLLFVSTTASSITEPAGWSVGDGSTVVSTTPESTVRALAVQRVWSEAVGGTVAVTLGSSAPWTTSLVVVRGAEYDQDPLLKVTAASDLLAATQDMPVYPAFNGLFVVGFVSAVAASAVTLSESTAVLDGDASVAGTAGACPAVTAGWVQGYSVAELDTVTFGASGAVNANWALVTVEMLVRTAAGASTAIEVTVPDLAAGFESTNVNLATALPDLQVKNTLWWTFTPVVDTSLMVTATTAGWDVNLLVYEDNLPYLDPETQMPVAADIDFGVGSIGPFVFHSGHQYWVAVQADVDTEAAVIQSVKFEATLTEVTQLEPEYAQLRFPFSLSPTSVTVAPASFDAPVAEQIKRVSWTWPAPPADLSKGGWTPTGSPVIEDWGTLALVVDGHERTTFRGVPVVVNRWTEAEPFGPGTASLSVPSVIPIQDEPGAGDLSWLTAGSAIDIYRLHPDGTTKTLMWGGEIVSWDWGYDDSKWSVDVECQGSIWAGAANQQHHAPMWRASDDRGHVIADTLNNIKSRRYASIPRADTGIYTTQLGSWESKALDYVQDLLSDMTTSSGASQWTVKGKNGSPRHYEIRTKNMTTISATFRAGQPGILPQLTQDFTTCPNVIYGWGISSSGAGWGNWFFPGASEDDAPAYPFSDPAKVISVGGYDRDSETDSGDGVTRWQRRMRELGYRNLDDDGVYSATDEKYCKRVQDRYGILVDGVVGPQTWAATFGVGSGADVGEPIRLPLARNTKTAKHWYNADGSVRQNNPNYDHGYLVVETDVAFGQGVSKDDAIDAAKAMLDRMPDPGWSGKVVVTADPPEGSRFEVLRAGGNIKLRNWAGADRILHIAQVEVNPVDQSVTCDVDTRFRDLLNLIQIRQRNRENPKPGRRRSRALSTRDSVVTFDSESRGGIVPRCALYGGLWTVLKIPLGQLGNLVKVRFTTSDPASKFSVALFGTKVQAADLVRLVGNPLADREDGYGPYDKYLDELVDDFWFIEGWGQYGQACGYYPGTEAKESPLTGRFIDTGGVEFEVKKPPWIYVALYAKDSCKVAGRLYPAAWAG